LSPSKATIVCAEPQLFVADIKRSCEFFHEKLGFSLIFSYGDPPYYAQVGRDAARLNLRCVEGPVIESAVRDREELLSVSMTVATADEIKLLFLEFQSAGVTFHQTLKKQPWGAKNFIVKDPDANLLLFAGPANSQPPSRSVVDRASIVGYSETDHYPSAGSSRPGSPCGERSGRAPAHVSPFKPLISGAFSRQRHFEKHQRGLLRKECNVRDVKAGRRSRRQVMVHVKKQESVNGPQRWDDVRIEGERP